jgi:hypothetical protein
MKNSKFSWADIVTLIVAIIFSVFTYLGLKFMNIEQTSLWVFSLNQACMLISFVMGIIVFGLAYGAKLLKTARTNCKRNFVLEMILIGLYALISITLIISPTPLKHYFSVGDREESISKELSKSISQAKLMFTEYETYVKERRSLYENSLRSAMKNKKSNPQEYYNFGFSDTTNVDDNIQLENKLNTFDLDLIPSNYSDSAGKGIKDVAIAWLEEAVQYTQDWSPFSVTGIVNDIEGKSNEWLSNLVSLSTARQQGEDYASDFPFTLQFGNVKSYFKTLTSSNFKSYVVSAGLFLLMLISWFISPRDQRCFKPWRLFIKNASDLDNEL